MRNNHSLNQFSVLSLLAFFLALPISSYAIGVLDQTFGKGGIVTTDLGSEASVMSLHQQNDGKIIVVGKNGGSIILLRYNSDGSLDTSFGIGGKIITAHASSDSKVRLTIQSDGLFAVGNNSSVIRYTSTGTISEQVNFPAGDVASFGYDGKIASATLIPAAGTCFSQQNKISYNLYNRNGALSTSAQFCSSGIGSTGVVSIWGIVPSTTNSFYIGYTHRALNASNGWVREMVNNSTVQDISIDPGGLGFQLVDLAATENPGFVSLGYFNIKRHRQNTQAYNFTFQLFPQSPIYKRVHAYQKIAALKENSQMLVLNEDLSFSGFEYAGRFFEGASEQSSVYVQPDNKIIVGGNVSSGNGYKNIRLIRYSTVYSRLANTTDFDDDGKSDISVWRPSSRFWYIQNSSNGSLNFQQFGLNDDKLAPADFDGDGKTDIAVFRPSNGTWYWLNSSNGSFSAIAFGTNGDLPVPVDFDGDGKADVSVFRPSNGTWYSINSSNNSFSAAQFGSSEDKPTIGDFDGDGKADIAVFRPSNGAWYRLNSSNGQFFGLQFGIAEDKPTPADFDGDGKTDISVFRPSNGAWYRLNSSNGSFAATAFGMAEDKPVAADYDGDGKADIAVFRPSNGNWYLLRSTAGFAAVQFGVSEDSPTPNAFVR